MPLVVQIVLALILLVGFVAIIVAKKTLHWTQILLVISIELAAVGVLFLAAETVRTHHDLRAKIPKLQKDVETAEQQHEDLLHGSGDTLGVLDFEHQLQMVSRNRGRVWRNVMPAGDVDNQGRIEVEVPQPRPHGLAEGSIVFAFESSAMAQQVDADSEEAYIDEAPIDEGDVDEDVVDESAGDETVEEPTETPAPANTNARKQYLGEFRVIAVSEAGVALEPVQLINQRTGQRLADSRGPWSLYEMMPPDRHSIFAGMTEEELRQLLPEESIEEYIRHGTPATADDDEFNVIGLDENDQRVDADQAVKSLYDRPLRDYAFLFADLAQQQVLLRTRIQAVSQDNAKLAESIKSAERLGKFRQQQFQLLDADDKGMKNDRQVIEAHRNIVLGMLANAKKQIDTQLGENSQNASLLTDKQLNQIQLINSTAPAPAGTETPTP